MPDPNDDDFDLDLARGMLRRHGVNLEGACWWCGGDEPYPCRLYRTAEAKLLAAGELPE